MLKYTSQYPENYDWLTDEQKDDILDSLKWARERYDIFTDEYIDARPRHLADDTRMVYSKGFLDGMINACHSLGIHIEYGLSSHRNEYIFVTKEVAEMEEDYYLQNGR